MATAAHRLYVSLPCI